MPRSLAACLDQIKQALDRIHGQNDQSAKRLADELQARLVHGDIEEIFQGGLHEYLTDCLEDIDELGSRIQRAYLGARMRLDVDPYHALRLRLSGALQHAVPAAHAARQRAAERRLDWTARDAGHADAHHDGYGNMLHVLTIDKPVTEIAHPRAAARWRRASPIDEASDAGSRSRRSSSCVRRRSRAPTARSSSSPSSFRRRAGTLTGLRELAAAVLEKLPFQPGVTARAFNSAAEAFELGTGVCQDHAHVFIACCRHLGVPARYVSRLPLFGTDAQVASHAWAEAWVVDRWRSFDITNGRPAGEDHIQLAIGADYLDACPIRGMRIGGGGETMAAVASVAQSQQ